MSVPSSSDQHNIVTIASLLASRLCHDLVNPVGALSTGLDVLSEDSDPEMREHAMALIKESTEKTIAVLTFARLAFGSSGGWDGDIEMGEVRSAAAMYYAHVKADLEWALPDVPLPKARARSIMNLVLIAEKSAPRAGSVVRVEARGEGYAVIATGPKVKFSDEVKASLEGSDEGLQAKETPAYLAYLLADFNGDKIVAEMRSEQEIVFGVYPSAAVAA